MPGKVKTAAQLKQAFVLRDSGYSLAAIACKTGISASTLTRHFKKHSTPKGGLTDDAVTLAREQLLNDAGFISDLKQQMASVIVDDLAQFVRLREAMTTTLDDLMNDATLPPHYRARGLAALATALKLTQEMARKALRIDDQQPDQEQIPELIISELTADDVEVMRKNQILLGQATGDLLPDKAELTANDVVEET